ncbi:MAG: M15 family metallopeptidase [Pseudomonadota bacterium]
MRIFMVLTLAVAIVAAPVAWHLSRLYLSGSPDETKALKARIEALTKERDDLAERVENLEKRVALAGRRDERELEASTPNTRASDSLRDAFAQVVLIANRRQVNDGLSTPTPSYLEEMLGLPREDLTDECQPMTNPKLSELLTLEDVGPIRVNMLQPAIISLKQVFANVQVFEPELYARITSAGSLCVRRIRGSEDRASAHAYGLALDINIDGVLDTLGDGKTQLGLTILSDFFKKEGWIWGAAFGREDSMHFEVSKEKLEQWRRLGRI